MQGWLTNFGEQVIPKERQHTGDGMVGQAGKAEDWK